MIKEPSQGHFCEQVIYKTGPKLIQLQNQQAQHGFSCNSNQI